jgi:uncharacterized protein YecT (DUF1311 family)
MQRIDGGSVGHASGTAHPAMLLALAIGVALGATLSSVPAKSAELDGNQTTGTQLTSPAAGALGEPKRVQTVRIPAEPAAMPSTSQKGVKAAWQYEGDDDYRKCIDTSDGTNTAWGACGSALVEREDDRLNQAWKRAYAPDADDTSKDLLTEQRAWIAFKEKSCQVYASGTYGREGQVLSFPLCRAGIIAQRTVALDRYADDSAAR